VNRFITISCKLDSFNTVAKAPPAPTINTICPAVFKDSPNIM